jgi:two-component system, NtrC family, nitrogen regulation sensor histidine kinase NtrY
MEATMLLRSVMREIDVAVFAFDEHERLRLVNRAGERLLAQQPENLLGQTAAELGLEVCLDGPEQTTLQQSFPGGAGRFGVRRTRIRERGLPLELVVISDLTQALSEQELQAWQRLVRVLGHELNNSLAPIKSIAGSLVNIINRDPLAEDWREDMIRGLTVITSRSESLSRFIGAYARLAKLPRPQLQPLDVAACVGRAVSFETRLQVEVVPGQELTIQGRSSSTSSATPPTPRSPPTAASASAGAATAPCSKSGSRTRAPASPPPPTYSSRSLPPSPEGRASDSFSAARSPKATAAR